MRNGYVSVILTITAALGLLIFTGCTHEMHELRESTGGNNGESGANTGLISMELSWSEPSDAVNSVTSVQTLIMDTNGTTSTDSFDSSHDVASQPKALPEGPCTTFITVNMTEENGYLITGIGTRAGISGNISVSPLSPGSIPATQAWFGIGEAVVEAGKLNVVRCDLLRTVPSIEVRISGVPEGTSASVEVQKVADSVFLTATDDEGNYGVPSEDFSTIGIGSLHEEEDGGTLTLTTSEVFLFPTAAGIQRTYLGIYVTTASGTTLQSVADAPAMLMGHHYSVDIEYDSMRPYMYLDTCIINDWQEEWTVNGSVLDPDSPQGND